MKIGKVDLAEEIMIIAEIGNNHEGNFALAVEMIGLAARAGATAVKFQTIVPEKLVSLQQTQRIKQLSRFQLTYEQFESLSEHAASEGVLFLSTPFDIESAQRLEKFMPAFKIASGDNNFYPLIKVVAETGKPIILSTGLADLDETRRARDYIYSIWRTRGITQEMALLHCVVSYPTPPEHANLLAIRELQSLGVTVGYSDHTMGIGAAVLSVALGARIIEKHFTISKDYSHYRDHQLSADPKEFAELVQRVRDAQVLLGDGHKHLQASEKENLLAVRRSIVAGQDLDAGHMISWNDLNWVRPGGGIAPGNEAELLGKCLIHPIRKGEQILLTDVDAMEGD